MRKALVLSLLLLVLSVICVCAAHEDVNAARDQLELTERVLYGDKSAAEGVTVRSSIHYQRHLFWDTSYAVDAEPMIDTQFRFSQRKRYQESTRSYSGVNLQSGIHFGLDGTMDEDQSGISAAYRELEKATPAGEERTKTVYLKDYYAYYPLALRLDFPGSALNWFEDFSTDVVKPEPGTDAYIAQSFTDFFKIPVLQEEQVEISITKNANGDIVGYGSGSTGSDSFNIWAESALTDDACYFTFNSRTTNGNLVDTSLIPGGYGIYCLPYSAGEPEDGGTQMGELSMVYPLDPTVRQVKLYTNPEQTKLLLLTLEDGKCVLTVIGIDTMQPLQRLELAEPGEDGGIWDVFNYGAFMALSLSNNRLVVVSLTDEDEYVLSISTELTDPENPLYYLRYDSVMAWYGGRLAVSNALMNDMDRNKTCGFYLAVYDKSGLLYYGEYASSLDAGAPDDYMYRCLPEDIAPLALRWGT